MADNVPITPGSGADIAADEIGGVFFQRIKNVFGIDGVATDVTETTPFPVNDATSVSLLQRIFNILSSPLGFDKSLSRQRVTGIIESGTVTTVTTVTTVSTVTGLTNIDGLQGGILVRGSNNSAWADCVRARIT